MNIEIIGFSVNSDELSVHIAWDKDGEPQHDFDVCRGQLLEILLQAEYIDAYCTHNRADVCVIFNGQKHWLELERWLSDEINDELCAVLLQTQFNLV